MAGEQPAQDGWGEGGVADPEGQGPHGNRAGRGRKGSCGLEAGTSQQIPAPCWGLSHAEEGEQGSAANSLDGPDDSGACSALRARSGALGSQIGHGRAPGSHRPIIGSCAGLLQTNMQGLEAGEKG